MSTTAWIILVCAVAVVFLAGGIFAGYLYRKRVAEMKIAAAEDAARKIIEDGEKQAEAIKKEKLLLKLQPFNNKYETLHPIKHMPTSDTFFSFTLSKLQ